MTDDLLERPANDQRKISRQNELLTNDWFEALGFDSHCLDKGKNLSQTADWLFESDDAAVICEVKTIFSGTSNEAEEKRLLETIEQRLTSDERISGTPFDVTISFSRRDRRLYDIRNSALIDEFLAWVVNEVQTAAANHGTEAYPYLNSSFQYLLLPSTARDGKREPSVDAVIQLWGPTTRSGLHVAFPFGGGGFNKTAAQNNLPKALSQLKKTEVEVADTLIPVLRVIALWSESANISLFRFLAFSEVIDHEFGLPERYGLLDFIFERDLDPDSLSVNGEPYLDAIIYFERRDVQFEGEKRFFPVGLIIMNPYLPEKHALIMRVFSKKPTIRSVVVGIKRNA